VFNAKLGLEKFDYILLALGKMLHSSPLESYSLFHMGNALCITLLFVVWLDIHWEERLAEAVKMAALVRNCQKYTLRKLYKNFLEAYKEVLEKLLIPSQCY